MSFSKQIVQQNLFDSAKPLTGYLVKLYLFPSSKYVECWRKGLWIILNQVPKLTTTHRFPKATTIFEAISGYTDMTQDLVWLMVSEYRSLAPERSDIDELIHIMTDYFTWLSETLSQKGVVLSKQVYSKLDELGL